MALDNVRSLLKNEGEGYERIQQLRRDFSPDLINEVKCNSRGQAAERLTFTVHGFLTYYSSQGLDLRNMEPGHGAGHLVRDYANACVLATKQDIDPRHIFPGSVSGSLHDTGCAVQPRYADSKRAVRHGEAGALLFLDYAENFSDLNNAETLLIACGIAGHAHYPGISEVVCEDRTKRTVEPYLDLDKNGNPIYAMWLPRWIDRLDCHGPTHLGRHYLTTAEEHEDFDGKNFFDVKFADHMKPLSRDIKEVKAKKLASTMLEHIKMFADSQNNTTPYGKHDAGAYILMRDAQKNRTFRIVKSVQSARTFSIEEQARILSSLDDFLAYNIEQPAPRTVERVKILRKMFEALPDETRNPWLSGFQTAMNEYKSWAEEKLAELEKIPADYSLPGITDDIREVIIPQF